MNSYFASVEQQDHPEWRGLPVGVCEHLGGIIIAASVQAKQWGIKTGTPVWEAKKMYPKIILAQTSPERYRHYHRLLVKIVAEYTGQVERYSIDEVFLELTRVCNVRRPFAVEPFVEAERLAGEIKQTMRRLMGECLTCSIGIAENKLLAKIASDLKKPDGLTTIRPEDKSKLYDSLQLLDIPGIGYRTEKRLRALGITSLSALRQYPRSRLVALFGLPGYHLYNLGQLEGSFSPEVKEDLEAKSIGHMYTLPKEYRTQEYFDPVLYKLSEMVARRLRKKWLSGRVLSVYVHTADDKWLGRSARFSFHLWEGREIFIQSRRILAGLGAAGARAKLIGVSIGGLGQAGRQGDLFGREDKARRLAQALDKINGKYGGFTVCRAPVLKAKEAFQDSVGFGRIKEIGLV
ncbi:MAG: DNA polymerase IV [Patescibacteria group bacterium]|nr:DNA polymerase IV [Patescibacteria group bacterium]